MSSGRANDRKRAYLCRLISRSPVYVVNGYKYFVYPLKGITTIKHTSLCCVTELLSKKLRQEQENFKTIVTVITDGVITSLPVAMRLKKDLLIARDFHYNYRDAVTIHQRTGYHARPLYVAGAKEIRGPVIFVDAVVSTGMTALGVVQSLRRLGLSISSVYTVVNKAEYGGETRLREAGITFHALFDVRIEGSTVICVDHETKSIANKRQGKIF